APGYGSASEAKETAATPGTPETGAGNSQRLVVGQDIPADWWTVFQSTKLNTLVEQAIKSNPDVKGAEAAVRQAHELYAAQRDTLWPMVQGSFSTTRSSFATSTISTPIATNDTTYSLYTAQLSLSYVPDVFGGSRRAVEASRAQA